MHKNPLEKITSPEQLDRLLTIIRLPGWISLACLGVLIGAILLWSIFGRIPVTADGLGIYFDPDSIEVIQTEMRGIVEKIYVKEGEIVEEGSPLMLIKEPGRDSTLKAPTKGKVLVIEAITGEGVDFGKTLIWFQRFDKLDINLIYSFFPIDKGGQIKPGMDAHVKFEAVQTELYGKVVGKVKEILLFGGGPMGEISLSIPSATLRTYLSQNKASIIVIIEPEKDPSTPSGYVWTTKEGPPFTLESGAIGEVKVFLEEKRPINYIFPFGGK